MSRLLLTILAVYFIILSSCKQKNVYEQLTNQFSSYEEAKSKLENSNFKINEGVNTSKSSWIKGASFHSCNGETGYFILVTDNNEYLYANMPYKVWSDFKNANSFGKFYNQNIKHRYLLQLTK